MRVYSAVAKIRNKRYNDWTAKRIGKECKMKMLCKKCVLVMAALAIALGSLTAISGCKKKESVSPPPQPNRVAEPNK
jgi:hypothetical protein